MTSIRASSAGTPAGIATKRAPPPKDMPAPRCARLHSRVRDHGFTELGGSSALDPRRLH